MAKQIQDRDRASFPNSPECGQWETLLVDAMDGQLRPEDEATFSNHMASCAACTEMFEQVRRGREWLEFLSPEPEVPTDLLQKILVETGHGKLNVHKLVMASDTTAEVASAEAIGSNVILMTPVWQRPGFSGRMRRFAEPRLLMTAAMAFFSIALTLSMTGVRISRLSMADLKPASVRSVVEKRIMTASTPIVRYYDHLRFVYEVESRMRELRRSSEQQNAPQGSAQPTPQSEQPAGNGSGPGGEGETHRKDGGSQLHPNEAPQQTVIPPSAQWSSEPMDAGLEGAQPAGIQPAGIQPAGTRPATLHSIGPQSVKAQSPGGAIFLTDLPMSSPLPPSAFDLSTRILNRQTATLSLTSKRTVFAMPDRSKPCIA